MSGEVILQHIEKNVLSSYLSGDLPEKERTSCERHLMECDACRGDLALLIRMLDADVSSEETAILDLVEAERFAPQEVFVERPTLYQQFTRWLAPGWKLAAVSAVVLLITAATLNVFRTSSELAVQSGSARTLEARLSSEPYSQFVRTRIGSAENASPGNDELRRLGTTPFELGRFYLQHNEFAKAIEQLEDAKTHTAKSAEILNDLGVAYLESPKDGDRQKAAGEFKEALRLNPKYAPAVFNLALAYERAGEFSFAEQELRRYLQMDPDSGWAREVRSKLQLWKR